MDTENKDVNMSIENAGQPGDKESANACPESGEENKIESSEMNKTGDNTSNIEQENVEMTTEKSDNTAKNNDETDKLAPPGDTVNVTSMEYRTIEGVIAIDNSSDSGDADSDSDSDESSKNNNTNLDAEKTINRSVTSTRDQSPERKVKLNRYGFEDVRTKGEILPEELPPLEELTITVDEAVEMLAVGTVASVVGVLVIVKAGNNVPALNDDTILFLEGHKVLGQVFEVFGPVKTPWYSVRFNDAGNIENKGIHPGDKVFCAPKEESFTKFVFVDSLKRYKGSDASWEDNNEPPERHLEYSDDEQERQAKADRKNRKKPAENETKGGNKEENQEVKNRRKNNWPPKDGAGHRNNNPQGQKRNHNGNPFRGQPNQRQNLNNQSSNFYSRQNGPRSDYPMQGNRPRWAPPNSQQFNGPPSQFGGPPNFQNPPRFNNSGQQYQEQQPGVFGGNQQFPHNGGNQFVQQNTQNPGPVNFSMPPPRMNGPPNQECFSGPNFQQGPPRFQGQPEQPRFQGQQTAPIFQGHQERSRFQGQQNPPRYQGQQDQQPMFQGASRHLNPGPSNFPLNANNSPQTQNINHNGQPGPNPVRVHGLNPAMPSNGQGFNQKPVSERYEQVNLTGSGVGPYRPNIRNDHHTGQLNNTGHTQNGMIHDPWEKANSGQNYQGPSKDSCPSNQSWSSNNPQYSSGNGQLQNTGTNNVVNQNRSQNMGHPPAMQNGQNTFTPNFTNGPGNHGNQMNMQMHGNRFNNSTGMPQAPYPTGNVGNANFVNFSNNQQNQPSHIMDPRFIQGN